MFYLNYLDKLIPMKFQKDTIIIKKKSRPEEIFFIIKGSILNMDSKRIFSTGALIGETDLIYKRVSIFKERILIIPYRTAKSSILP